MFSFANPQYLYLLLLIPLFVGLMLLSRLMRRRSLARFGRPDEVQKLMPDVSAYKPWVKLGIEMLVLAMLVVVLARPRAGAVKTSSSLNGIEVMIAVDVSNSMKASSTDDPQGVSRLQQAKLILEKLIDRFNNDKVGLIVFAGNAYMQMPLTADAQSAKLFLNDISTNMAPTQGTAIGAAIGMAMKSFSHNSKAQKAIIVITDGENHEDDAVEAAAEARKAGVQVNVMGVGSTKGAPIPDGDGGYMRDDAGQVISTALNEDMAQKVADAGKGICLNGNDADAVEQLTEALSKLSKTGLAQVSYSKHDELFPIFAWIALVLIVAGTFVLDRKNQLLKKYNFFSKTTERKSNNESKK